MSVWRVTLHDMTNSLVFWKANFTNVLDPKAQGKVTSQPFGYTGGGNEWESGSLRSSEPPAEPPTD